jgi:hypothetical protein
MRLAQGIAHVSFKNQLKKMRQKPEREMSCARISPCSGLIFGCQLTPRVEHFLGGEVLKRNRTLQDRCHHRWAGREINKRQNWNVEESDHPISQEIRQMHSASGACMRHDVIVGAHLYIGIFIAKRCAPPAATTVR